MIEKDQLDFPGLVGRISELCRLQSSGTVLIVASDNQTARLVLDQGQVRWIAFQELRGELAISALPKIMSAQVIFNPKLKVVLGEQQLPPTEEILQRLGKQAIADEPASSPIAAEPVAGKSAQPSAAIPEAKIIALDSDLDLLRMILEREAMEFLGPMSYELCDEYLQPLGNNPTRDQIRHVINSLAFDINDPKKADIFNQRVEKALGMR